MNWKVFLNIAIVVIGILTIVWSNFTEVFIIYPVGITVGLIIVLIGISLITKPKWKRIMITLVLTVILVAITFLYETIGYGIGPTSYLRGWPFPYHECTVGTGQNLRNSNLTAQELNEIYSPKCGFNYGPDFFPYVWLVIDILFWYLISSIIIWAYERFRQRK